MAVTQGDYWIRDITQKIKLHIIHRHLKPVSLYHTPRVLNLTLAASLTDKNNNNNKKTHCAAFWDLPINSKWIKKKWKESMKSDDNMMKIFLLFKAVITAWKKDYAPTEYKWHPYILICLPLYHLKGEDLNRKGLERDIQTLQLRNLEIISEKKGSLSRPKYKNGRWPMTQVSLLIDSSAKISVYMLLVTQSTYRGISFFSYCGASCSHMVRWVPGRFEHTNRTEG